MAAIAHFSPITLHSPRSVHGQSVNEQTSHDHHHDHVAHGPSMEQADEEDGDTAYFLDTAHPSNDHAAVPAASSVAHPPASPQMDSDMEGGEDTAGGVSPSPWAQLTNADLASVPVTGVHDPPTTSAPLFFAPLSPMPPPPPPPPPLPSQPQLDGPEHALYPPPPPPPAIPLDRNNPHNPHDRDDEDVDDDDDDDDDDDERSHASHDRARNFYPFEEDTSVPDAEELRILQSYNEWSALDDAYWQEKTYFDPQDPDLVPGDCGMIEWVVNEFNGTKENPRKELLLRSPSVNIGGHEWRIKLLPHGNVHTDRLSLYVENVSVQSLPQEEWPQNELPMPVVGETKVMKRRTVAAQISIIVYNPDEPRVNEFKSDAHQFHQDSPDHGWPRFSSVPWYEIHRRSYAQRQPLLRNDTLAIKAYVRVIHDPTGCMWALSESEKLSGSASMTGLSAFPSFDHLAVGPIFAMWLHLRPFREILYLLGSADLHCAKDDSDSNVLCLLQTVLYRMRARKAAGQASTSMVDDYIECTYAGPDSQDVVQTMDSVIRNIDDQLRRLVRHNDPLADAARAALERLSRVFGDIDLRYSGARQTKLSLQGKSSTQDLVDGLSKELCQSEMLTIDLARQVFDSDKRCWKKVLDKARLDDQVVVAGVPYTLYAFATHEGHLQHGTYASFFRPSGIGGLWYTYKQGYASCQTRTKAVLSKEGVAPPKAIEEPFGTHNHSLGYDRLVGRADAVAYVVVYIRNDVASKAFDLTDEEPWDVPQWIVDDHEPKTAVQAPLQATDGASSETLPYEEGVPRAVANGDLEMNDVVTNVSAEASSSSNVADNLYEDMTIDYLSQPFYKGDLKGDVYHGKGRLIYLDGNEYTGSFVAGCREGQGTMVYQNGDEYTGDWKSDQHHGRGTYTEKRTGNVYRGYWEEGKKHGEGTTFWKVSEEESRMCRICYCAEADAAFYDCGHVVACASCARRVEDCPVCRRMVRDVVKLYYLA